VKALCTQGMYWVFAAVMAARSRFRVNQSWHMSASANMCKACWCCHVQVCIIELFFKRTGHETRLLYITCMSVLLILLGALACAAALLNHTCASLLLYLFDFQAQCAAINVNLQQLRCMHCL